MVSYSVSSAGAWARREFGGVQLGDERLNRRAVEVARAMAADPSASIPAQGKRWKRVKGAYRLFDHDRASFRSLSEAHWQQTRDQCAASPVVVLLIQDTTWLDYAAHRKTEGLGWFGRGSRRPRGGSGLFLHSVLAVAPEQVVAGPGRMTARGRVIGLVHGKLWARTGEPVGRDDQAARSRRRSSPDRESLRWGEAVREVGAPPAPRVAAAAGTGAGTRWLHVGDRESDIFDLYERTRELVGVGFVVRVSKDRNATAGHDTPLVRSVEQRKTDGRLMGLLRSMPALGATELWVAPRAGREGRLAKLRVSGGPVTIWSPQVSGRAGRPLRCWALRVWEQDPPDGVEPLEWMILSSEPVESLADALRLAGYYALRWLIEEYHQCLKSGCRVEQRQLEHADRLAPLIGMLCVVAVRLLQLKNDARLDPDAPAARRVPEGLVRTLAKLTETKADPRTMTVRTFTREVAKLGGFLGRRGDGEPGWRTLWQGWRDLTLIHAGRELAEREARCG